MSAMGSRTALGRFYIAVCGPDPCSETVAAQAETVGRLLAEAGAVLVCGGLGGAMEVAARGCEDAGGTSIGILPGAERSRANPHLTFAIPTGLGEARNALVARAADAVIAVAGEYGTLSEIALALKMGIPVVGLDTWELSRAGRESNAIMRATSPEQAVEQALRAAEARRP